LLLAGGGLAIVIIGSLILALAVSLVPNAIQGLGAVLGGHGPINAMATVLLRRLADPFSTLLPVVLIAVAMAVFFGWIRKRAMVPVDLAEEETPPAGGRWVNVFLLILVFWGALLILFPEYFFLRDFFGSRMNTVFKFYFQAWAFLSLPAAFGIIRLLQTLKDKAEKNNARWAFSAVGSAIAAAALILGLIYFPLAVWTKTNGFKSFAGPTLDASAYLQQSHPEDAKAIAWMLANLHDNGPLVEAVGNDYDEYAARVSTHTGIPSVLGWIGHEDQWRGGRTLHALRPDDIAELYRTTDWTRALEILDKYGIRYVYFGTLEANTYSKRGLDKFLAHMDVIYQTDQVIIFERKVP
jgi:uncharacterized membrane protein